MAAGIAAFGLAVSYLVDTPGAAERGSEWDSELGIYIVEVAQATGAATLANAPGGTATDSDRLPTMCNSAGESRVSNRIGAPVFFFFSNRIGCMGSLLLSLAVTAVLFLVFFR